MQHGVGTRLSYKEQWEGLTQHWCLRFRHKIDHIKPCQRTGKETDNFKILWSSVQQTLIHRPEHFRTEAVHGSQMD